MKSFFQKYVGSFVRMTGNLQKLNGFFNHLRVKSVFPIENFLLLDTAPLKVVFLSPAGS